MGVSSREIWYSLIINTVKGGDSHVAAAGICIDDTCSTIEVTK
jgi:hypothetical protein